MEYRITKLKEYCLNKILKPVAESIDNVNVNFLSNDLEDYSLVKMPTDPIYQKWINGQQLSKELYNLVCNKTYSVMVQDNLDNIGFFEQIEAKIKSNNNNRILPDITGIESIQCMSTGSVIDRGTNSAVFSLQLQIIYREDK